MEGQKSNEIVLWGQEGWGHSYESRFIMIWGQGKHVFFSWNHFFYRTSFFKIDCRISLSSRQRWKTVSRQPADKRTLSSYHPATPTVTNLDTFFVGRSVHCTNVYRRSHFRILWNSSTRLQKKKNTQFGVNYNIHVFCIQSTAVSC